MRVKIIFLFSLTCVFSLSPAFCQQFDRLAQQSLSFFEQKDTINFEATYPKLYIQYLKENIPEYSNAINAAKDGDVKLACTNIELLVDEDLFIDELPGDSNFTTLHGSDEWKALLQTLETTTWKYKDEIRRELKKIQNKDQGIRLLYLYAKDESLKSRIHDYIKQVDGICAAKICSILDTYGWLGTEDVGSEGNETLFLAIQHVDDLKVQQKYMPMLRKAVKEGKAEAWHLAFLTDRVLMNQGKKQIYGTQKIAINGPERYYIVPLEYPDRVDSLREEIGLPSLAEDWEEEGLIWNLETYKQQLPAIEKKYKEYHQRARKER